MKSKVSHDEEHLAEQLANIKECWANTQHTGGGGGNAWGF